MRIVDLADQPWHIPRLSRWHHREWTHLYPHEEVADFARELDACLGDQLVPSTFIAIDGALLGSASLLAADMLTHPELTPWVASVYVRRAARASGVGSALIRHIMQLAARKGLGTLYLFTPDSVEFYRRLDWVVLSRELYQGVPVTLMQVDLGTSD
ncbi:MAG: GNAT family N-acetyltransferase [Halioglobus sp.]|nr:GNAT family N-acetyltransferase [Halioglobus sp.]